MMVGRLHISYIHDCKFLPHQSAWSGSLLSGTPAPPWANRSLGRNFGSVEKRQGDAKKLVGSFTIFTFWDCFRSSSVIKSLGVLKILRMDEHPFDSPTKSQHKPPGNHETDLRSLKCWDTLVIYTVEHKADKDTWDAFMILFWMSLHVHLAQPSATTTLCKS